ncbi:MAG TPA: hypothetical protein P5068_01970 [Sedimentisphaerales bacterium]|nr:hypothetical protein [Sedimentisphaerales bacterium]HRV46501.1 hypothetical protein [Sedimentisphaerales bacterium]
MSLIDQINQHEYLYLATIGEPGNNTLCLVIEEAKLGEPEADAMVGDIPLPGSRPIISDADCCAYEIFFDSYIAYSVRDECFTVADDAEVFEGVNFCIYSKSHFLDYIQKATIANEEHPGPYRHYGINCLNHIIDVDPFWSLPSECYEVLDCLAWCIEGHMGNGQKEGVVHPSSPIQPEMSGCT